MRRTVLLISMLLLGSCALPGIVSRLDEQSPPAELGRPGWVRTPARVGAWVGGLVGGVASLATLPITWPVAQLAEEPLGYDKQEFMLLPVSAGASAGHTVIGMPFDFVDYLFRRAWVQDDRPSDAWTPMPAPAAVGDPSDPAAGDADLDAAGASRPDR